VHVVYEAILAKGETELERSTTALAFSGLAARLSMGFSFLMQGLLLSRLPDTAWARLIASFRRYWGISLAGFLWWRR